MVIRAMIRCKTTPKTPKLSGEGLWAKFWVAAPEVPLIVAPHPGCHFIRIYATYRYMIIFGNFSANIQPLIALKGNPRDRNHGFRIKCP